MTEELSRVSVGVQIREKIIGHDDAPNFAMRVFDVQAGGNTFHSHARAHEIYIISGTGLVWTQGKENEQHCFVADSSTTGTDDLLHPAKGHCRL